ELVTGRRAFDGEEITDVLARLIEREPDWNALPAATPSSVHRLLQRCLTKDPKARLRDIGEARLTIDEVLAGASGPIGSLTPPAPLTRPVPAPGVRRQPMLPWALAVLFALVALVLFVRPPARTEVRPLHVEITLPADVEYFSGPSLSADGTRIALVGVRVGTR